MGGLIVQHKLDVQARWNGGFDVLQKVHKLLLAMPGLATAYDLARGDVKRGKERGGQHNRNDGTSGLKCPT